MKINDDCANKSRVIDYIAPLLTSLQDILHHFEEPEVVAPPGPAYLKVPRIECLHVYLKTRHRALGHGIVQKVLDACMLHDCRATACLRDKGDAGISFEIYVPTPWRDDMSTTPWRDDVRRQK